MKSFFHYNANWGSDTETLKLRKQILGMSAKSVKPLEPIADRPAKAKLPQGVDAEYTNTVAVEALEMAKKQEGCFLYVEV